MALILTRADKFGATLAEKEKTRYVVAHDGGKVVHPVLLTPDLQVVTGLKYLVSYDTEEDAKKDFVDISFTDTVAEEQDLGIGERDG